MKLIPTFIVIGACPFLGIHHVLAAGTSEDLNLSGQLDINGNELHLGSWSNDTTRTGSTWIYKDGAPSSSLWLAHRFTHEWVFKHAGITEQEPYRWAMKLAADHTLSLYENIPGSNPAPSITLNPSGSSWFRNDVILNGTKNLMFYQFAPAAGDPLGKFAILNFGLGDARYLRQGTLSFGSGHTIGTSGAAIGAGNTATGAGAFAAGESTRALGAYSVAMGSNSLAQGAMSISLGASTASGEHSIALGKGTALGSNSIALGFSSAGERYATAFGNSNARGEGAIAGGLSAATGQGATALGISSALGRASTATGNSSTRSDYATALGNATATHHGASAFGFSTASGYGTTASGYGTASGPYATAFGRASVASGESSTALGCGTTAAGYAQLVVGQYNVPNGSASFWSLSDDLFVVGNGISPLAPSNALVVKKSGNTAIKGSLDVSGVIRTKVVAGDIPMFKADKN